MCGLDGDRERSRRLWEDIIFLKEQRLLKVVWEERAVYMEAKGVVLHCQCLNKLVNFDEQMGYVEKALMMVLSVGVDGEAVEGEESM